MIEAGVDLVTVSKILGHASIQMTMRYCQPTEQNLKAAVRKLAELFQKIGKQAEIVEIRPTVSPLKSFN